MEENLKIFNNKKDRANILLTFLLLMFIPVLVIYEPILLWGLTILTVFVFVNINRKGEKWDIFEVLLESVYICLLLGNFKTLFVIYTIILIITIFVNNKHSIFSVKFTKNDYLYDLTEREAASIKSLILLRSQGNINCDIPKDIRRKVKIPTESELEPLWFNPFVHRLIIEKHYSIALLSDADSKEKLFSQVMSKHLKEYNVEKLVEIFASPIDEKTSNKSKHIPNYPSRISIQGREHFDFPPIDEDDIL